MKKIICILGISLLINSISFSLVNKLINKESEQKNYSKFYYESIIEPNVLNKQKNNNNLQKNENNILLKNENNKNLVIKSKLPLLEEYEKIIYIGDSRTVGMKKCIEHHKVEFICEEEEGLNWLKTLNIEKYNNYKTIILLNLGINDLEKKEEYVTYLKELKLANLYFIPVFPINEKLAEENGYSIRNEDILEFNNFIKENFNYIDMDSFFEKNEFKTKDGINYLSSSYIDIFEYLENY